MNILFMIVLFLSLLTILAFTVALKINFNFNFDRLRLTLIWLLPVFKALVLVEDTKPTLTIYLFNRQVYKGGIKSGNHKTNGMELIKLANPTEVKVRTQFGFRDPFNTGLACGAVNIASQFVNIDTIQQFPDFTAEEDFIYFDATAKINIGSTLLNLYKAHNANLQTEKI